MKQGAYFILALACAVCTYASIPCSVPVSYQLEFHCNWTEITHPKDYPSTRNVHFSDLCGTLHNDDYFVWRVGSLATQGVKRIAEYGDCSDLEKEVEACEAQGSCAPGSFIQLYCEPVADRMPVCWFSTSLNVTEQHSKLSAMSMIFPSNDISVGISDIELCVADENGNSTWVEQWPEKGLFDVYAFDAGTDSGVSFESPLEPTDPQEPIWMYDEVNEDNLFYNAIDQVLNPLCQAMLFLQA